MKKRLIFAAAVAASFALSGCATDPDVTSVVMTTTATVSTTVATTAATTAHTPTSATTVATTTTAETTTQPTIENEQPTQPEQTTEAPTQDDTPITTPDGYTLADTDIQNPDGTYTQSTLSADTITVPDFLADKSPDIFVGVNTKSNASKIPYSEITLENAAEAFPYLGFIGYVPDYIEIMPTDTQKQIRLKVMANMAGDSASSYWSTAGEVIMDTDNNNAHIATMSPTHYFTSQADYEANLAAAAANRASADAADKRADEAIANGDYTFSGTEEELLDIINSRR